MITKRKQFCYDFKLNQVFYFLNISKIQNQEKEVRKPWQNQAIEIFHFHSRTSVKG